MAINEGQKEEIDLSIPIYLDQKIVFDLLAVFEDGFTQIYSYKRLESESSENDKEKNIDAGINIWDFINVTFGTKNNSIATSGNENQTSGNKVHTPASLFWKLRKNLVEHSLLNRITSIEDIDFIKCGNFVEFEGVIRKNPLLEAIDRFLNIFNLIEAVQSFTQDNNQNSGFKCKNLKPSHLSKSQPILDKNLLTIRDGLKKFRQSLTTSNDIYAEIMGIVDGKVVLVSKNAYYNDSSIQDLINGQFRIIGRVTQVLSKENDDKIDLLRNTDFNGISQEQIEEFINAFSNSIDKTFTIPHIFNEIGYPGFQIIPISIYR